MKKYAFALLLLLACFCLPAAAAEETRTLLENNLYYDKAENCYIYELKNGQELKSSVRSGMMTNGPVQIELPVGLNATLYRNGIALSDPDYTAITEPGEYSLSYATNENITYTLMKFTVIGQYYNGDADFVPPSGFLITAFFREGVAETYWNGSASLEKEGDYVIRLTDRQTGRDTTLRFKVDRTPPTLALKEVSNGKALSAVDISDLDPQDTIYIARGGRQMEYTSLLTKSGNYKIILTDPAGNKTTYEFEIIVRYNFNYLTFVLVILAGSGIVLALMLYSRRSRKIR